jgi:cell migration-inducing and hyaluronan-binding protein
VATAKDKLSLSLREMDKGSWVLFELPGFTSTLGGTAQPSLEALRAANTTSFFKDDKALWVKLVVEDPIPKGPVVVQVGQLRAQANIAVSKQTSVATASLDDAGSRRQ